MLRLVVLICWLSGAAHAGAWPREQGTGFASAAARFVWPRDLSVTRPESTYLTLYLEYGLTERLTLGLDLGHSVSGDGKAVGFVRLPLARRGDWVMAAEIGAGVIAGQKVLRPGLSVGRGLQGKHGGGWLSADALVEIDQIGGLDAKMDVTWGMALPRDRTLILQVQTGIPGDRDPFLRLAPSLVTPLPGGLKAEIGATLGLSGDNGVGLMFGLWREF